MFSKLTIRSCGLAKQRIDRLLELLPLEEAHTVHIDAFEPRNDPYHGTSTDDEAQSMQESLRYWASRGVDVTTEWLHFAFVGMTPMVWHLNTEEHARLNFPPALVCGGGSEWNFRRRDWRLDRFGASWIRQPQAGCLHERAWGANMSFHVSGPEFPADFVDGFCLKTLPWYYLNRRRILQHVHTAERYEVHYSGGIVSAVTGKDDAYCLREGERVLISDTDVCLPAAWLDRTLLAYSRTGGRREWQVPTDWPVTANLAVREWNAPKPARRLPVRRGRFELELNPKQALWLVSEKDSADA